MPRTKPVTVAAVLCLVSSCAFAQQTPPMQPRITETPMPPAVELPAPSGTPEDVPNRPLTADEAVQIALRHQPSIRSAAAGVSGAEGRVQAAKSGLLPSLGVSASHLNVDSDGAQVGGGSSGAGSDGYQWSATTRQLLFDFNHTRDLARQASAHRRAAVANLTRAQSDLAFQVKQAFYAYVQNARLAEVNEANIRSRQGHLDLAKARLEAGVGLPSDVVRAETARAEAILGLNLARTSASVSRVALAQLMGIDPRTPILASDAGEPEEPADDVDALVTAAIENRPEVLQARAARDAAGHGVSAAKTGSAPSLGASAGWNQRGQSVPLDIKSFTVGLSVSWSPFDSGLTAGRVKEAAAVLDSAEAQFESARLQVISEVSQAYLNLKAAEQRVVAADAGVANAEEAVRLTEGRYRGEIGTFIDVLDAQAALVTARTNRVNAATAVNTARAALVRAVGGDTSAPLPGQ